MTMEADMPPIRCDSSLSVVKIQPATRKKTGSFPFVSQKFNDPEIEELYQLHSINQKRTELFRCFLYAILFYCIAQIVVHSFWVVDENRHKLDDHHEDEPVAQTLVHTPLFSNLQIHQGESKRRMKRTRRSHNAPNHATMEDDTGTRDNIVTMTNDNGEFQKFVNGKYNSIVGKLGSSSEEDNFPVKKKGHSISSRARLPEQHEKGSQHHGHHRRRVERSFGGKRTDKMPKAAAYQLDEEHSQIRIWYIIICFPLLGATTIAMIIMLLPVPKGCPKNPHVAVILWTLTILATVWFRADEYLPLRLGLCWILVETFLMWVTLPLRFRTTLMYAVLITVFHTFVTMWQCWNLPTRFGIQLAANLLLLGATNLLGLLAFYLNEKRQRRAFMDTRQSLQTKLDIEEKTKEQERLLLSVLPEHLALKMRQDLGAAVDSQFKKIYMSRHENVSILYADIVGFTAISSTYSASELVKILNELFARFDRLAEKYHQIRIKILGDCYYCICGAPDERDDHGVLCVHMGLSMVKAIKYVREKTNSPVDMRVGIHTGAILAGVMGQRQWQFDIYSKDVELANKMESSGKPGRVHVSEKTLSFLNNEFEVERGDGEKREESLRIAGIKTYFIVKVLKPYRESITTSAINENGELQADEVMMKDIPSELHSAYAEDSNSAAEELPRKQSELESYRLRLKEELLSRDGYRDLSEHSNWFTLRFRDPGRESEFLDSKEPYTGASSVGCPLAYLTFSIAAFFVISLTWYGLLSAIIGLLILLLLSTLLACETSTVKARLKKIMPIEVICSLDSKLWARRLMSFITVLILTATNFIFMIPCFEVGRLCPNNTNFDDADGDVQEKPMVLPNTAGKPFNKMGCLYPAYFVIFCTLFLLASTLLTQTGSWFKSFVFTCVLALHVMFLNCGSFRDVVGCSEKYSFYGGSQIIPETCYLTVFAIVLLVVLFILNRRLEKSARVLFLWKTEGEQQKEKATLLRQKNEALVYNILPQHVATHFLGSRRRKHEELYSQSYAEVGILFASMPNFSDFYSEETVNNQGLECLRFLNEVISDFDALLELPKFAENIIKIKTIGSTYMAASGLHPDKQAKPDDTVKVRWHHLCLLVEFALELTRALNSINEQSYNHFVLKMGINHGPGTSGVIGARKPHYDIWGNSVNVASRMESTGKAGCIQVTEETYRILRLYGYQFEQRGLVNVKGKGQLMTYYLIGRGPDPTNEEVEKMLQDTPKDLPPPYQG